MNKQDLFDSMKVMWDFYGKEPNKAQAQIWFTVFEDCDLAEFQNAIGKYLSTTKNGWFPMPAEVKQQMVGDGVPGAGEAWLEAVMYTDGKNVDRAGDLSINVNNPITNMIFSGRESMKRKAFIEDYEAVARNSGLLEKSVTSYNEKIKKTLSTKDNYLQSAIDTLDNSKKALADYDTNEAETEKGKEEGDHFLPPFIGKLSAQKFFRSKDSIAEDIAKDEAIIKARREEIALLEALIITAKSPFSKLLPSEIRKQLPEQTK